MASTGVDLSSSPRHHAKVAGVDPENVEANSVSTGPGDRTQRRLKSRHIQLIGMPSRLCHVELDQSS
jgi:hypothetical protein